MFPLTALIHLCFYFRNLVLSKVRLDEDCKQDYAKTQFRK
jgi:hypothetical protein